MGEAVVGFLVERLCDLLNEQEAEVLHGVRDYPVEEIIDALRILQGLLRNAGAKRNEERIRIWASEVREVVYDATDILESLILKVLSDKKGIKNSGIKGDFKTIKSRISELITRSRIYGIRSLSEDDSNRIAYNRQHPLNRNYSHVAADQEVIGLEGDIEYLVGHLTNSRRRENCYRVISICGMGGLGKTTLAGKIYNHPTVMRHFDCLSWVCISRQWQTNDILRRILLKLSPERRNEDLSLRDDAEIVKMIFDILRGKIYLVVLDDIWSNVAWDCIKGAFPVENMSSKILLTTRNVEVARHVERESLVHQPKFLNEEQSWELLLKKTCIKRNRTDPRDAIEMEKLGREMIRRCRGLPLAILVLGGILATKPTLSQWEIVHEDIGTGEGFGKDHQAEVEEMLISSYYDLPDELKPCFLYLCKFPEDSVIEAERLYQLWMAEGMVLSKDRREGETMMEVAESYVGELSHRCMVQVEFEEDESSVRKFKSCYLHDLMRDLSLKKAKEEDFFKVLDIQNGNNHEVGESSSSSNYTRRLVISPGYEANSDDIQIIRDKEVGQHLRSLLLTNFVKWEWKPPIPVVAGFHPSNLKYVRILALEGIRLELKLERSRTIKNFFGINCCSSDRKKNNTIIQEEDDNGRVYSRIPSREEQVLLSNLIHLRYLSFRWSSIKVFLSYIGNLEHLQTLDLRVHGKRRHHSPSILSVSGMLRTMGRRLHHLYLPHYLVDDTSRRLRLPLNGLSNLETLENFNPAYFEVKDLIKLTNLRKLTMCVDYYDGEGWEEGLEEGLNKGLEDILKYLLSSQVSNRICFSSLVIRVWSLVAYSEIGRQNLLRQILGCCNLHQLEIHGAIKKLPPVVTDNHDNVNFLSSLTTLLLFRSSLEEDPMATLERIPNLRSLVLSYNAFLGKKMVCSAVGFPHLKSLELCYLRNLEEWVVDDGAMPSLSTIQIECCNKLEMLPDGFRFLTALRVLNIVDMPKDFRYRVQSRSVVDGGVGEDSYKVCHVPCINVRP